MHPPADPPPAPRTPLQWVWSELRIGLPLCVGVAVFLSVVFGDHFVSNLVYSLCIGLLIQSSIELGRFGMSAWLRRRRVDRIGLVSHWPGWPLMAPWVVACSVGGYWAGSKLGDLILGTTRAHGVFAGNQRALAVVLLVTLTASIGATFLFYARGRMATIEAMAEAARRTSVETQLKLLQSQLEPHMLFNTLANLRVLIGLDPVRAQAMLDHLIGFLRATLTASRSDHHPLSAEFDRVADYLALMAIRMGPRLQVVLKLPDELRALPVPPLLLQPLVENCIHHGLEPKVAGGRIELSAWRDGPLLRLAVRDTGVGLAAAPASAGTGFGTAQVRERLATLFGDRARLELTAADDAEGGTLATVTLPSPTAPARQSPP